MEKLYIFVRKRSLWIILATIGLCAYSSTALFRINFDDDVTIYFPEKNAEVELFKRVSDKFGGLDVALIGLEMKDVFTLRNLKLLRKISQQLATIEGIGSVTSLTEMRDYEERKIGEETGSVVQDLIGNLPDDMTQAELQSLKQRVMSKEHVVGSVVSRNADAALIICRLERKRSYWQTTQDIKRLVSSTLGNAKDIKVYYGGAPFVNSFIMTGARTDIKHLSPWIAIAVLIIIFTSFKSIRAAILALLGIALGLVITLGLMPIIGLSMDLVTTSLPMILAAIGSAYGIHILARYFQVAGINKDLFRHDWLEKAFKEVGIPVIMSAVTTLIGFASFLVMDIKPLRNFGFVMAVGVAAMLILSLLFIGAVINMMDIGKSEQKESSEFLGKTIGEIALKISSAPRIMSILFIIIIAVSFYYVTQISTDTNTSSYFPRGSDPIEADNFLVSKFGGSLYIQVYVEGDMKNPIVLREMQKMEDYISSIEGVTDLRSITQAISLTNDSMTGIQYIPPERDQVASLKFLVEDDPAVSMLIDKNWQSALIQVRVGGFDTKKAKIVCNKISDYIKTKLNKNLIQVSLTKIQNPEIQQVKEFLTDEASALIAWDLSKTTEEKVEPARLKIDLKQNLYPEEGKCPQYLKEKFEETLKSMIIDDEYIQMDETKNLGDLVSGVCSLYGSGKLNENSLYELLLEFASQEEKDAEFSALKSFSNLQEESITGFRKGVRLILAGLEETKIKTIASVILEPYAKNIETSSPAKYHKILGKTIQYIDWINTEMASLPAGKKINQEAVLDNQVIKAEVTGYPVLYQKMNESVLRNQIKASSVAFIIIFVVIAILFKSLLISAICLFPAIITLGLTFGILGFLGIPMDMGVSMVSNIVLGAAVDYPIHFFWKYREVASSGFENGLMETMKTTGKAIAINAIEVMAGFGLLLFAVIIPIKKSGGLISLTLLFSGVATLFLMPVFIKLWHSRIEQIFSRKY